MNIMERALNGLPLEGWEIIDSHAHVGPGATIDRDNSVERYLRLMDAIGIQRTAFMGFMFGTGRRLESMNNFVAEFLQARPDRFIGYCYLNPNYPEFLQKEMERCFDKLGFRGLKLHISWNAYPYDGERYFPVYEFANERKLPIIAHCWGDDAVRQFARMARKYPNMNCLVAHTGAAKMEINLQEAKQTPNLFLELAFSAGTPWNVERAVREVGAERVVWGSDTLLFAASHQIGKVIFADVSESDKRLILGGNAKRLFKL